MKCKLYECENETTGFYIFCSGTHYMTFKNRQAEMDDWFDADLNRPSELQYAELIKTEPTKNWAKPARMDHNIEEVELLTK